MSDTATQDGRLAQTLESQGFASAKGEVQGACLVLQLQEADQQTLLADPQRREQLVEAIQALGYERVALSLF